MRTSLWFRNLWGEAEVSAEWDDTETKFEWFRFAEVGWISAGHWSIVRALRVESQVQEGNTRMESIKFWISIFEESLFSCQADQAYLSRFWKIRRFGVRWRKGSFWVKMIRFDRREITFFLPSSYYIPWLKDYKESQIGDWKWSVKIRQNFIQVPMGRSWLCNFFEDFSKPNLFMSDFLSKQNKKIEGTHITFKWSNQDKVESSISIFKTLVGSIDSKRSDLMMKIGFTRRRWINDRDIILRSDEEKKKLVLSCIF